eukprot:1305487-Rhodomonas_salina.1
MAIRVAAKRGTASHFSVPHPRCPRRGAAAIHGRPEHFSAPHAGGGRGVFGAARQAGGGCRAHGQHAGARRQKRRLVPSRSKDGRLVTAVQGAETEVLGWVGIVRRARGQDEGDVVGTWIAVIACIKKITGADRRFWSRSSGTKARVSLSVWWGAALGCLSLR